MFFKSFFKIVYFDNNTVCSFPKRTKKTLFNKLLYIRNTIDGNRIFSYNMIVQIYGERPPAIGFYHKKA